MTQGWIKLHRQLQEHDFWYSERFTRGQAWVDMLMMANHDRKTIFIRGNEIVIDRGQMAYSIVTLSQSWQWNRRTVAYFLDSLEKRRMITQQKNSVTTLVTIVNYEIYQETAQQSAQQTAQQSSSRLHTNKNDKNDKNDNTGVKKEILKELRRHEEIGNPGAYLSALQKKAKPYAIVKAWNEWKRGNGVNSPAEFYNRCLHYSQ